VRYSSSRSRKTVKARLTRRGKVYAKGETSGNRPLRLGAVRRVLPGSYRLTVVATNRSGHRTITRHTVTVKA
jgi:hypothetical protein